MHDVGPPPDALLPHRGGALFLRRVLSWEPGALAALCVIPSESPFVRDGRAPAVVGLDAAAQAAGALLRLEKTGGRGGDAPRPGYLVAVREARFPTAWLRAGRELRVDVRRIGSAGPLAVHAVRLEADGVECLVARLSTYAP
jgi:predicted hotdog family 3-hydroxylacyl-ACP dehydratase